MVLTYAWDIQRDKNAARMRSIFSDPNPSAQDLEWAKVQGFEREVDEHTGAPRWFWSPGWDRRIVELFHLLLTFEDPLARFRHPVYSDLPPGEI
jgi:hypothetical protein